MIRLIPLATMTAMVSTVSSTRRMPIGTRQIYVVSGGTVRGERINGTVLAGGGDDLLVDSNGTGHVDARVTWRLDDEAIIYVTYLGRVLMTHPVADAFKSGGETQYGDTYFVTQLRFEAGDARYAWLNDTVAIAEGRIAEGRSIQYQIYQCDNRP
jgi:hypothetical protein